MSNAHLWMVRLRATLAAIMLVAGCEAVKPGSEVSGQVRIATGEPTAVYYAYGKAYSQLIEQELPRTSPSVLVTAASAANIALIRDHSAEVGFTQADIAATEPSDIRAIAKLYDDYVHLVTRADAPYHKLTDLRGRRVSLGVVGSGTEITSERLFTTASINVDRDITAYRLGLDDAADALREGRIDAFFFGGGLPVTAITKLGRSVPIRMIGLGEYVRPMCDTYGPYYSDRVIPASAYGTAPVVTIGTANYLVVSADMPQHLAYALTRTLFANRQKLAQAHPAGASLNRRSAINTQPLRLHPGAAHYYRDAKT